MDEVPAVRSSPPTTRRTFLVGAIHGIWAAMIAILGFPAVAYLLIPAKTRRRNDWVDAGDVARLEPQIPLEIAFRRNRVDGWRLISEKGTAWVVKFSNNEVVAYAPQCTHLGCAYHWDQNKKDFVCPCHNSVFSVDGKVQGGPAPRPLDRYQTKIEGNKLLLGPLQTPPGPTA